MCKSYVYINSLIEDNPRTFQNKQVVYGTFQTYRSRREIVDCFCIETSHLKLLMVVANKKHFMK